ncbi:ribonuclease H-like superfamily protein [Striga asiatica]|uniref:Ribonuclease H-like superfamily protein n=1 Tax=Striga asiatica TaxID=4170 RepID=A0A5A7RDN7_STRAF|nr:ribonuclease H-like superfamily protein [Striga asiatica]
MALLDWHKPIHRNSEKAISQMSIVIRNGHNTKLNEANWVPGLHCRKPQLRVEVDGNLFCVKDLLLAGGVKWDKTLVRVLFTEADAEKILQIKSLKPRTADQWHCSFLFKGKLSV